MKKFTILIVLGLLCLNFKVNGQSKIGSSKPLAVGDTLPDIELNNVINYKSKSLRLSNFKDQLVILDFWATWCSPCIRAMPGNYALQKRHPGELFFLLVNPKISRDQPVQVQRFLNERKNVFQFPSLVTDTIVTDLFKIHSMGNYVWVKNNIVVAITLEEEVTEGNILKMIAGTAKLHERPKYPFNSKIPLFYNDNGGKQQQPYVFRSLLLPYAEGFKGNAYDQDSTGKVSRIYRYNTTALDLILGSNLDYSGLSPAHLKVMVADKDRLLGGDNSRSANAQNLLSYEALFPQMNYLISLNLALTKGR